ncbi:N-6 DNA methylase, partial [Candidatus Saccharibacteria bacterium]|nr:N-6 DNA methylase [Candidatus Saccharibacteria bacterium]
KPEARSQKPEARSQKPEAVVSLCYKSSNIEPPENKRSGGSNAAQKLIKSKHRVKEFGEVFTPENIVKQMCDLCEPDISAVDKKIFEPTCGNGNFLVEILRRKLTSIPKKLRKNPSLAKASITDFELYILWAVSNIYAIDIQQDNVSEARRRMQNMVFDFVNDYKNSADFLSALNTIIEENIIVGNTLSDPSKIIFFDFTPDFEAKTFTISKHTLKEIEHTFENTTTANALKLKQAIQQLKSPPPKKQRPSLTIKKPKHKQNKVQIGLF